MNKRVDIESWLLARPSIRISKPKFKGSILYGSGAISMLDFKASVEWK